MTLKMEFIVQLFFFLTACHSTMQEQILRSGYTAAVVEFAPESSPNDPPSVILSKNLDQYEQFVLQAKQQSADVIVFPEYGLSGPSPSDNRRLALEFSQVVAEKGACPCDLYNTPEQQVVGRLSCSARNSSMYLVVNLLERMSCEECASDHLLIFNTDVAFDRQGVIVARYRKFNLFAETALNRTDEADIAMFTSDWGATFGLVTCFDIMFRHPAVTLVQKYNVTDIIFPTAWIQELPFLTAVQTQASWSIGMNVNLLAAGYNRPLLGSTGSGVYGGSNLGSLITYMAQTTGSKLLVATIPAYGTSQSVSTNQPFPRFLYTSKDKLQDYNSVLLSNNINILTNISVCHEAICCELSYELKNIGDIFKYQLLAYDGIRTHANGLYASKLQVCALVACSGDNVISCSDGFNDSKYSLDTNFGYLYIKGVNMKSTLLLPNTLLANSMDPISPRDYVYQRLQTDTLDRYDVIMHMRTDVSALHTFGVYSHDYEPYEKIVANSEL